MLLSFTGGLVPKASLKVRSYFTDNAVLLDFVRFTKQGNVEGIQGMLTQGIMSPETMATRWTPLTFAVAYGCVEICELLLAAGADPNMLDPCHIM